MFLHHHYCTILPLFTFNATADLVVFALYANRKSNGRETDANETRLCSTFSVSVSWHFVLRCRNRWRFKVFSSFFSPSRVVSSLF